MKKEILIALPCYNEALNLRALIIQFDNLALLYKENFNVRVLIINDCSKDETESLSQQLIQEYTNAKIEYVKHSVNKGLTGGINTAFQTFHDELNKKDHPIAFGLMDGDNSHSPFVIPDMLKKICEGYDVVIASRFRPGARIEGVVWWRQILSFGLTCIFKIIRNVQGVRDYSCGYRLYSPSIVKKVKAKFPQDVVFEKSFASMVEILLRCDLAGALMTEVPFLLRYDLKMGDSKMPFKKTILGNLKLLQTLRRH